MDFEQHLKQTVTEVRSKLAEAGISYMYLSIIASGPTGSGDVNIVFHVAPSHTSDMPSGGTLEAVLAETLHRETWKNRNAPLCLPSGG